MDGISRTSGVGAFITLGGKKYAVQGRILRHYGTFEAEVRKLRGNPFDLIRQAKDALGDDEDLLEAVVERAFEEAKTWRMVSQSEVGQFLQTWSGIMVSIWLAIKDNDPALTIEKVTELVSDEYESRMRKARRAAAERAKKLAELAKQAIAEGREVSDEEVEKLNKETGLADAEDWLNEITAAIDAAGGEDEEGNSIGSSHSPTTGGTNETQDVPTSEPTAETPAAT